MSYIITPPKNILTTVDLPASKSISNRVLLIHALTGGEIPQNLSDCDDTVVVRKALSEMPETIDIKAAGTAMRFLTAYLSITEGEHSITGTERMKKRPIKHLVDALRYIGADITYLESEGFPPLHIKGKQLEGGRIEISGDVSSQYLSALLLVAPKMQKGLELKLTGNIVSRPYIDLTIYTMKEFGAAVDWEEDNTIVVKPQPYKPRPYFIENDWSAASYWYETLALLNDPTSKIKLTGLTDGSKQGDSVTRYIFSLLGVKTSFEEKHTDKPTVVTIQKHTNHLPRLDYNFINSPDLAQTFAVCCAAMNIPFHFTGLKSLKIKETDRIEALQKELRKLGYVVRDLNDNELIWDGEMCEPTYEAIDTYEDHRMAMAFAPFSIKHPGLKINAPEVVSKSYPHFWNCLKTAGFGIKEE